MSFSLSVQFVSAVTEELDEEFTNWSTSIALTLFAAVSANYYVWGQQVVED